MGLPSRPRPHGCGKAGTAKSRNKSLQFVAFELSIKALDWQTLTLLTMAAHRRP